MSVVIFTALCEAMESSILRVECAFMKGFSGLQLLGSTSEVCKSGVERARAALDNAGVCVPAKKILISLTPADLKKEGNHFDLPIAVALAILVSGKTCRENPKEWLFAAELSLNGHLKPVKGIVSFALAAAAEGFTGVVIAEENREEVEALASLHSTSSLKVIACEHIEEVLGWLFEGIGVYAAVVDQPEADEDMQHIKPNFDDMILEPGIEKAAQVSALGLHNILLYGSPGSGKSMFACRLTSIMPAMPASEHLDAMRIHSIFSYKIQQPLLLGRPPFRSPHHQSSPAAILGIPELPGEISLAHGGVLFLDEFPEFRRDIIEGLREPLESGTVRVSRAKFKVSWKSHITLVAACNNCPCGWLGSKRRKCSCPMTKVLAYKRRISGPILDRIDLHLNVPELPKDRSQLFLQLKHANSSTRSKQMREKVLRGRDFSYERNHKLKLEFNRDLQAEHMLEVSFLKDDPFRKLVDLNFPTNVNPRTLIRCLRVARSIADLELCQELRESDIQQAWKWSAEASAKERGEEALGLL